jgi:hypothetical protein
MRRHDSYEDYAHEIDEEAEREAHEAGTCPGPPRCGYCLDDWEESNREELDKQGYYDDAMRRWTK